MTLKNLGDSEEISGSEKELNLTKGLLWEKIIKLTG